MGGIAGQIGSQMMPAGMTTPFSSQTTTNPMGGIAGQIGSQMMPAGTTTHTATPVTTTPTTTTPAPAPVATACKLDYQRADNMWAAFGRPDGQLGTETISLSQSQDKVFITDWKYEKTRNDGSNYYGSHLRIATNAGSRTIRLQLRSTTLTGLAVSLRTGSDTFWIRMEPGSMKQLQADLMEVFCE